MIHTRAQDPEVQAMTNLVEAYQRNDITEFEKLLRTNRRIMDDAFIRNYVEDLLKKIRTQVGGTGAEGHHRGAAEGPDEVMWGLVGAMWRTCSRRSGHRSAKWGGPYPSARLQRHAASAGAAHDEL